ncbi:TonB-dependent receptor [Brucella pseudogrignonensis]|uniref:TonB-dependent receptor n=1 Tax=Brucella pseudogrignonensis TaxID=419475 RepID=UPI001E3CB30B|nr:TonB-dependent receptor [Brucella pseudogrignonensis]MCD4512160.1 TonB-dependent receptor [Brucella pseudogrignonensis]
MLIALAGYLPILEQAPVIHSKKKSRILKHAIVAAAIQTPAALFMASAGNAEDKDAVVLETITVTARNIEEEAKDVPFSLSVKQGNALRAQDIDDSQSLARNVPGFNHADSGLPFSNLINIRGIGSSSALISPSVNYYIDGVPVPARMFDMPFGNVERVEILRGPQGTHFGLNSQAGAVNIITADPAEVFSGNAGILYGSQGRKEIDATIEGPINDIVSGRISGRLKDFDGDLTNILWSAPGVVSSSDTVLRARTYGSLSGKLVFDFDDAGKLTLAGSWSRDRQKPTTGVWLDDPDFPRNAFNPLPKFTSETTNLSAKYERELDWAHFTSLTGYSYYNTQLEADIVDGFLGNAQSGASGYMLQTPGLNVRRIDEHSSQFNQEFRLDGETEGGTRWVTGLSGLYSHFDSTTDITSLSMANGSYRGRIDTTNLAAFGEVTIPLTERLKWIGGLRLTYERKDFDGLFLGRSGALARFVDGGEKDYFFPTGRTGLTFSLTDELTLFATIARGEKTGGYLFYNQFASLGLPLSPFRSAETWSYEAGIKAADLGGWLDLSTSVFYNDTKNEQLFTYNPVLGRFSVQNADTRSYGAELEAIVRPTDTTSLGANLSLLNAEITGGNSLISGNDVPYAPKVSTTLHAEYRHDLTLGTQEGEAYLRGEWAYTGSRTIDPANSRTLSSYSLTNLRVGWEGKRWQVAAAVENLFDEEYVTSAFQSGTDASGSSVYAGIPGEGRTFSLSARVKF